MINNKLMNETESRNVRKMDSGVHMSSKWYFCSFSYVIVLRVYLLEI
jgi:hypothetical protein